MATFLLCWAAVSVVGTFIAVSLIRAGKRNSRAVENERQIADRDAQVVVSKSF